MVFFHLAASSSFRFFTSVLAISRDWAIFAAVHVVSATSAVSQHDAAHLRSLYNEYQFAAAFAWPRCWHCWRCALVLKSRSRTREKQSAAREKE